MNRTFDHLDVEILECLGEYGPRNISQIARKLGVPIETARKRVKRLISRFSITFHANVYHTNIGLRKAFVFADAVPGYEDVLFKCLKANDFWLYVGRCYGRFEGCYGIYAIPKEYASEFEQFVSQLEVAEIARNVQLVWSTCLYSANLTENWFDLESKSWVFHWDKWMEEIPNEETRLPYTLVESKDFPLKADYVDVRVLAKLEVDSSVSFRELAKIVNMTPEAVAYHFKNHILKRGLLEKSQVFFLPFDKSESDFFVFIFKFDDSDRMARFASSLLDKPFLHSLGKVYGENSLIAHVYLPRSEFRKFVRCLSELIKRGFLREYEYLIEDFDVRSAQTISYEYFRDGTWVYDHEKHMEKLQDIVRSAKLGKR
ncbi:MAG: AsnC family protein [Candidatus Bathyarchaeota archaeon]|nr:AsnC family protein [Candidatus Bathyarchaeota archaeon]